MVSTNMRRIIPKTNQKRLPPNIELQKNVTLPKIESLIFPYTFDNERKRCISSAHLEPQSPVHAFLAPKIKMVS
jgi:hypothetical protein